MKNSDKLGYILSKKRLDSFFIKILKSKGLDEELLLDIADLLVEQGANAFVDKEIISLVAKNGYFKVVKYLIEKGGKVHSELINLAIKNCQIDVAEYLIAKNPKAVFEDYTIIYSAINIGCAKIVKMILDIPQSKEFLHMGYLTSVITTHQVDVFDLLIKYVEEHNLVDAEQTYCLELAIKEHQFYMLKKLIDLGVNITDEVLFYSIEHNSYDSFKYILSKKEFSIDVISSAIVKACNRHWINTNIVSDLLKKPHYKKCIIDSKKNIKKNRKKQWVSSAIKSMNTAIKLLKKR